MSVVPDGSSAVPTGVLYVNLGSPDAPTPAAVRAFLEEFLADPLVVDTNRWLWWLARKAVVLPRRAPASAALYRRIWWPEGSPLTVISRRFADALQLQLGDGFRVVLAKRYGEPSIGAGLRELARLCCGRVVVLTAFPQASGASTGTVEGEVRRTTESMAPRPKVVFVPPYYEDPGYIAALADRAREATGSEPPDHVLLSFHGYPVRYVEAGDPYRTHCEATARALAAELGLADDGWTLVYQSRFGRGSWLEPDVTAVAPGLLADGARLLISAPSFTADCLETLEELNLRLREACTPHGGALVVAPCLNDDPAWVRSAAELVRRAT